ncbi:MAG: hypothetical protein ACYSSM_05505 [Planctomycetota bacterium]
MLIAHALNRFTASRKLPRNIVEQGMKFRRQGGIKLYPTGESDHENT